MKLSQFDFELPKEKIALLSIQNNEMSVTNGSTPQNRKNSNTNFLRMY